MAKFTVFNKSFNNSVCPRIDKCMKDNVIMENQLTDYRNGLSPTNALWRVKQWKDEQCHTRALSRSLSYFMTERSRRIRAQNEIAGYPTKQFKQQQGDVQKKSSSPKISGTKNCNVSQKRYKSHDRLSHSSAKLKKCSKKKSNTLRTSKTFLEDKLFQSIMRWFYTADSKRAILNRQIYDNVYKEICNNVRMDQSTPTVALLKNELLLDITELISIAIEEVLADCDSRMLGMDSQTDSDQLKLLILRMKTKGFSRLVSYKKVNYTYMHSAEILENVESFDDIDHSTPYPNKLYKLILTELTNIIWRYTYKTSVKDMSEILKKCSKYLSSRIVDDDQAINVYARPTTSACTIIDADRDLTTLVNGDSCSTSTDTGSTEPAVMESETRDIGIENDFPNSSGKVADLNALGECNPCSRVASNLTHSETENPVVDEAKLQPTYKNILKEFTECQIAKSGKKGSRNIVKKKSQELSVVTSVMTLKSKRSSKGSLSCSTTELFMSLFEDNKEPVGSAGDLSPRVNNMNRDRLKDDSKVLLIDMPMMPNLGNVFSDETLSFESNEHSTISLSEEFTNLTSLPSSMEHQSKVNLFENMRYSLNSKHHGKSPPGYAKKDVMKCGKLKTRKKLNTTTNDLMDEFFPGYINKKQNRSHITRRNSQIFHSQPVTECNVMFSTRRTFNNNYSVYTLHSVTSDTSHDPVRISQPGCLKTIKYFMENMGAAEAKVKNSKLPTKTSETNNLMRNFTYSTLTPQRCTRTPLFPSSSEVTDLQVMIKNFVWNVQAWRSWIDGTLNLGAQYQDKSAGIDRWSILQQQIISDVVGWQNYYKFCDTLTTNLRDGNIVKIGSNNADILFYKAWLFDLWNIKDACYLWTQCILKIVNEIPLKELDYQVESFGESYWQHFKEMSTKYNERWRNYNNNLKISYEEKYETIISTWLPSWSLKSPVWVSSSHGVVPSGGVGAGMFEGEVIWLARVMHQSQLVPAALHPSKKCACVYAEHQEYHYSKYQVLCNAKVSWMTWRDSFHVNPVFVAPGVRVGRVQHCDSHFISAIREPDNSCYVNLYGRPLAFQYYEILVIPPL